MTRRAIPILLALALLAALTWSWMRLGQARSRAAAAVNEERECRRLSEQILSARPDSGADGPPASRLTHLNDWIDTALKAANCPPSSVVRIEPMPPRRLDEGNYIQKPATIHLQSMRQRQLLVFLRALEA